MPTENFDITSGVIPSIVQLEHMLKKQGVRFWRWTDDGRGLLVTDDEAAYLQGGGSSSREFTEKVTIRGYVAGYGPESFTIYPNEGKPSNGENIIQDVVHSLAAAGFRETRGDPDFYLKDPRREEERKLL